MKAVRNGKLDIETSYYYSVNAMSLPEKITMLCKQDKKRGKEIYYLKEEEFLGQREIATYCRILGVNCQGIYI